MTPTLALLSSSRLPSIAALRQALDAGTFSHQQLLEVVLQRAETAQAAHVFTRRLDEVAREAARQADAWQALGTPLPVLAGLPVTVKDLYDIAGQITTAGSVLRAGEPPATRDAAAVARLRQAGAALLGRTTMTEFAFSGVGINPHQGTPSNPAYPDRRAGRAEEPVHDQADASPQARERGGHIPGGSSSGAAVSVALGLAVAGLGSDTGGSIRIPAALCGLVGFKPTQARVPLEGAFPLSTQLDTACALTRCVDDALCVDGVLSGNALAVNRRPLAGYRLLLPTTLVLDGLEPAVAHAFQRALQRLSQAGAIIVEQPLPLLAHIAAWHAPAGFSAIEAYARHQQDLQTHREAFDPRVVARMMLGQGVSAADWLEMLARRREWIGLLRHGLQGFDALVCPTVPLLAPPIEALRQDDSAFFTANSLLLRNTFVFNYGDGCAISLPCHAPDEAPVGLMLGSTAGRDHQLMSVALAVEEALSDTGQGARAGHGH